MFQSKKLNFFLKILLRNLNICFGILSRSPGLPDGRNKMAANIIIIMYKNGRENYSKHTFDTVASNIWPYFMQTVNQN